MERGRLGSSPVEKGVGADWDVDLDVSRGYDRLFATCDGYHDGTGRGEGRSGVTSSRDKKGW